MVSKFICYFVVDLSHGDVKHGKPDVICDCDRLISFVEPIKLCVTSDLPHLTHYEKGLLIKWHGNLVIISR